MGKCHEEDAISSESHEQVPVEGESTVLLKGSRRNSLELTGSTQSRSRSEVNSPPSGDACKNNDVTQKDECSAEECEESELLQSHDSKDENIVGESPVVVSVDPGHPQLSWSRLLENQRGPMNAREAVLALGRPKRPERISERSPLSYKTWILQLTRRRRLEIFIAVGLSLWLAFFVVLAIFMNGNASVPDQEGGGVPHKKPENNQRPISPPRNGSPSQYPTFNFNGSTPGGVPLGNTTDMEWNVINNVSVSDDKKPKASTTGLETKSFTTTPVPITSIHTTRTRTNSVKSTLTTKMTATTMPNNAESATTPASPSTGTYTTDQPGDSPTSANTDWSTSKESDQWLDELAVHRLTYPVSTEFDLLSFIKDKEPGYVIGVGRADITGPPADVNMMGYANPNQVAGGIHFRQYSRAFVIGQGKTRVLFINIDACMGSMLVKLEVLKKLKLIYGELYNAENVCISGTHTHSAPAGFLQDVLFQITSMGYVPETLDTMVEGIVESVRIAHDRQAPGHILINKGQLLESNINRSPSAYVNNPLSERNRYHYNVDKDMTLLKFINADGKGIGMINWFPVHCTSMNNTNNLISGDNKGYAEMLFEQAMDPGSIPGQGNFVAAFAQSNEGDVSPNTRGPHCIDTGEPCDNVHSTCNGKVQNCIASGPGKDMFESTKIIGRNQYLKAMDLYKDAAVMVKGPVQVAHQYVDMANQTVHVNDTHSARTCLPAMGFSFAAGTTDGPGAFDFKQGDKSGNAFWMAVRNFLHSPSEKLKDCHAPKPILLDTGEMKFPYAWQPEVVDTQLLRIGQVLISAVPGEFTTMSGRRLSDGVLQTFAEQFPDEKFESVIAGLSNTYSDYIATFEEYHVQRYEGASTIFGPHTLQAYIQQYKQLAEAVATGDTLPQDTHAKEIRDQLLTFVPPVYLDRAGAFGSMGDVLVDVKETYQPGETVSVEFQSGNPRNSPTNNCTYLTVERQMPDQSWKVVHTDSSWDTKYEWTRKSTWSKMTGLSEVKISWEMAPDTPSGLYRINHYGHYKSWTGVYPYSGHSKEFQVANQSAPS